MTKYFFFLTVPLVGYVSIISSGWMSFGLLIYAFLVVPLLELAFTPDRQNLNNEEQLNLKSQKRFDLLLYSVLPFYAGLLMVFLDIQTNSQVGVGQLLSFGILCGVMAINAGHELGHRHNGFERGIGEALLILSLQSHFLPYHNHGHHRNVATPNDPATAKKNEPIYVFWFRSQIGSYVAAWRIEWQRLSRKGKPTLSLGNRMVRYTLLQAVLITTIYWIYGGAILLNFFLVCVIGALLLETVNYIEHYGLLRAQDSQGKYERVTPMHSWNSDHILGRLLLFELSRHSDHHANPGKPYQILSSFDNSPQMPTGYPGMMLLSLIPPIWFRIMNPRIPQE